MDRLSVRGLLELLLFVFLLSLSFKIFPAWLPVLRKEWILFVVCTIILLFLDAKRIRGYRIISIWVIYSLYLLLKGFTGTFLYPSVQSSVYDILMLFILIFTPLYIFSRDDQRFIKRFLTVSFVLLIVETIGSYFQLRSYPSAIRDMNTLIEEGGASVAYGLYKFGLVDYSQCHALPILIPPLFYIFKTFNNKSLRLASLLAILLCMALIWMSDSTTSLLLGVLLIGLGFLTNKDKNQTSILVIVLFAIPFIVSESLQVWVLDVLGNIAGADSIFAEKVQELQYSILHDESSGDLEGRMNRYSTSIDLFFSSPIIGSSGALGRHSAVLDLLATLGIVGFIPLALLFYSYFKMIYGMIPKGAKVFFLEAVLAGIAMLLAKGMWFWIVLFCLFVIMPFMFMCDFRYKKR